MLVVWGIRKRVKTQWSTALYIERATVMCDLSSYRPAGTEAPGCTE